METFQGALLELLQEDCPPFAMSSIAGTAFPKRPHDPRTLIIGFRGVDIPEDRNLFIHILRDMFVERHIDIDLVEWPEDSENGALRLAFTPSNERSLLNNMRQMSPSMMFEGAFLGL